MPDQSFAESSDRHSMWGSLWRRVEIFAVVTSVAFFGSVVANTLVFDSWGQTFIAIATPADVVMSGVHLALIPAMPIAAYAGSYAWVISCRTRLKAGLVFFVSMPVVCLIAPWLIGYGPHVALLWWVCIELGWMFGGGLALANWNDRWLAKQSTRLGFLKRVEKEFRRAARYAVYALLIGMHLWLSAGMAWGFSQAGYFSHPLRFEESDSDPSCAGRVLWTGERAVLIDCGEYPIRDVQVLYGVEKARFIADNRTWPDPELPRLVQDVQRWVASSLLWLRTQTKGHQQNSEKTQPGGG